MLLSNLRNLHLNQVYSLLPLLSSLRPHSTCLNQSPPPAIHSSPINCSHHKTEIFSKPSLKDLLFNLSNISPTIARRFSRVSVLKPEHILQILHEFDIHMCKLENANQSNIIEPLWGIFKWATQQVEGFKHLPSSCKLMASLLVQVGMYKDAEFLLSTIESGDILIQCDGIYGNIIEGYMGEDDFERAISLYNRVKELGLFPSLSCYRSLLKYFVQIDQVNFAYQVCFDIINLCSLETIKDRLSYEDVIHLLCRHGKIQEARNLIKKVVNFGAEPSNLILYSIATGYCEKKDYDDLLSFFSEINFAPDALIGNRIIYSVCSNFGVERAICFMDEMEDLGYRPSESTFGILIGWSCREKKLKDSFFFLSEMSSMSLKPHRYSYTAIMSGLFLEGMWSHSQEIFNEMIDTGIVPDMLTFRVLIAGYCKARQFDKVKITVQNMVACNLIQLSEQDDPLMKGFTMLGLNSSNVKIRRDNDSEFSKTEFFDDLGNGLYLETDMDEFEKMMTGVLLDSMIPDYNSLVLKLCGDKDFTAALVLFDEMLQWGQEPSISAFSAVVKGLHQSGCKITSITNLLEKNPKLANNLDQEFLNLLIQTRGKKGTTHNARRSCKEKKFVEGIMIHDTMLTKIVNLLLSNGKIKEAVGYLDHMEEKGIIPDKINYNKIIMRLCCIGELEKAIDLLDIMLKKGNIPSCTSYDYIVQCLCKSNKTDEALDFHAEMMYRNLYPCIQTWNCLVHNLCEDGRTEEAEKLLDSMAIIGETPSREMYNSICNRYRFESNFSKASEILKAMQENGYQPDFETHWSLIQNLSNSGHKDNIKNSSSFLSSLLYNSGFS